MVQLFLLFYTYGKIETGDYMIDLHVQTILGNGDMSIFRVLETIKAKNLEYFSLVDINHALAYRLFDYTEYNNLITGIRFKTVYNGSVIDLIGYDIDVEMMNEWYETTYPNDLISEIEQSKTAELLNKLELEGFILDPIEFTNDRIGGSAILIFNQLISQYPDYKHSNIRDFRKYEINNIDSPLFVDNTDIYLPIDEIISLIKKSGGKVFLAHPFEYRTDLSLLLEMVISKNLDGVEVFHSSASQVNSMRLIEFCNVANKLASIGTGFCGNDTLVPLGVHVDHELLKLDCFKWIFERRKMNE